MSGGRPGFWNLLLANRLAAIGLAILVIVVAVALLTPLLPLPDPNVTDPADRLLRPGAEGHLLGTDHLGRDILSRLAWGARVSLAVGLSATAIAALAGSSWSDPENTIRTDVAPSAVTDTCFRYHGPSDEFVTVVV